MNAPVSTQVDQLHDLFVEQYMQKFRDALACVSAEAIASANAAMLAAFERKSWVFIAGNGGSASAASHFACDLEKTVCGKDPRRTRERFRVHSLVDNVARLTAWANDETYDCVFSEPLVNQASKGDVLVVITASGNSPNIVAALETARGLGMTTIGCLGFDGGKAMALCDVPLLVPTRDYGIVEGVHGMLTHVMTAWLTQAVGRMRVSHRVLNLDGAEGE